MHSNFLKGFEKKAGIIGRAVKGVSALGGGVANTALTVVGALGEKAGYDAKMKKAREGTL